MPVAEFPGGRNWGYDGVHLFAPQSTYGGPDGLRALIDAAHAEGLAVILDVVYNHVGPEGNYLGDYAPYFTDRYSTPWGRAINLDGAHSDGVRRHLVTNAAMWFREYHVDALRLDAIHGIFDASPRHLLEELQATVQASVSGRRIHVIAESDLNDVRVIRPVPRGYGLDAQWSDDFHHSVRTVLAPDARGYFADFGSVGQVASAITESFVYQGQYSTARLRSHGTPAAEDPGERFVVCIQNHDQIANGSQSRRLTTLIGHDAHALAATLLMASPNLPMLFMGEEFAERAPFHYFISHGDPTLVAAVREGRRRELADLAEPGEFFDPQAETTFEACKLDWSLVDQSPHAEMFALYRALIALRRAESCLHNGRKDLTRTWWDEHERWLVIHRGDPSGRAALVACNLRGTENQVSIASQGSYRLALTTPKDPSPSAVLEVAGTPVTLVLPPFGARIYLAGKPR
jgi:maltooligosyltrehalose trehalohydrolase